MTILELNSMIEELDNPYLPKLNSMVYQIWEDGEITLQKAKELLWQRNLHMIIPGNEHIKVNMPHKQDEHSYAWVTKEDARTIREAMKEVCDIEHEECILFDAYTSTL